MNKSDLIDAVASDADISKASAGRAVDAVLGGIGDALGKGDSVSLVGFGTFSVRHRAAREGRNPQTGDAMNISARRVLTFKPSQILRDDITDRFKHRIDKDGKEYSLTLFSDTVDNLMTTKTRIERYD